MSSALYTVMQSHIFIYLCVYTNTVKHSKDQFYIKENK